MFIYSITTYTYDCKKFLPCLEKTFFYNYKRNNYTLLISKENIILLN